MVCRLHNVLSFFLWGESSTRTLSTSISALYYIPKCANDDLYSLSLSIFFGSSRVIASVYHTLCHILSLNKSERKKSKKNQKRLSFHHLREKLMDQNDAWLDFISDHNQSAGKCEKIIKPSGRSANIATDPL